MNPTYTKRLLQTGLLIGVWGVVAVVSSLQSYLLARLESDWDPSFLLVFRWEVPQWAPWVVLTPVVVWLGRRVAIERGRWVVPIFFHLAVGAAVVLVHNAAVSGAMMLMAPPSADDRFSQVFLGVLGVRFFTSLLVYGAVLGGGYAVDFYRKYRMQELTASRLETQLARAHLQALRMQLHPHFLFNTLHAVSVLIKEDPGAASRMVTRLGDFLRLAIDTAGTQEVALKEELEFLELYLDIEQTRFQDRLAVVFDIAPDTLGARVPTFILQPLVENSIKHGIGEHAGEGRIHVASLRKDGRLVVSVEDGGRAAPPVDTWKDGLGLATTRERLTRMYGADHTLEIENVHRGVRVSLEIPYRPEPAFDD